MPPLKRICLRADPAHPTAPTWNGPRAPLMRSVDLTQSSTLV